MADQTETDEMNPYTEFEYKEEQVQQPSTQSPDVVLDPIKKQQIEFEQEQKVVEQNMKECLMGAEKMSRFINDMAKHFGFSR